MNRIHSSTARRMIRLSAACLASLAFVPLSAHADNGQATPANSLPCLLSPQAKGVLVLFSGSADQLTQNFTHPDATSPTWRIHDGGFMTAQDADLLTRRSFGDLQLHVEFCLPSLPGAQERVNSAILLQGAYELKIRDSYGSDTLSKTDCGAIYQAAAPLTNACKAANEWQSCDIVFRAPRVGADGATRQQNARLTVFLNGLLVQDNVSIASAHDPKKVEDGCEVGPIALQYHSSPVAFRNVWVLPLHPAEPVLPSARPAGKVLASAVHWQEVPQGLQVGVKRVRFDESGYQISATTGQTIVVPFVNQNLNAMKFGRSSSGQAYFVNEGAAPVLYLGADGLVESALAPDAGWYPLAQDFSSDAPVYVALAPSWSAYQAMGWYPGMLVNGGVWSAGSNGSPTWMPGYGVLIQGNLSGSYAAYQSYLASHPGAVPNRSVLPSIPTVSSGGRYTIQPITRGAGGGSGPGNGQGGFGGSGQAADKTIQPVMPGNGRSQGNGGWQPAPPRRGFPARPGGAPGQKTISGRRRRH